MLCIATPELAAATTSSISNQSGIFTQRKYHVAS